MDAEALDGPDTSKVWLLAVANDLSDATGFGARRRLCLSLAGGSTNKVFGITGGLVGGKAVVIAGRTTDPLDGSERMAIDAFLCSVVLTSVAHLPQASSQSL